MTTKKSKFEKLKKTMAVSAFAGLSLLFVQKVYASQAKPDTTLSVSTSTKLDTIPKTTEGKNNVKFKNSKKVKTPPTPRELKENELQIPPPPPPAKEHTAAQFPEGMKTLRTNFQNNLDTTTLEGKGIIKTMLYIYVDENGKTTDVKVDGPYTDFNNESIKAMKKSTENITWKPATEDGKAAATVFHFPISIEFYQKI